jgi:hypothetical protein
MDFGHERSWKRVKTPIRRARAALVRKASEVSGVGRAECRCRHRPRTGRTKDSSLHLPYTKSGSRARLSARSLDRRVTTRRSCRSECCAYSEDIRPGQSFDLRFPAAANILASGFCDAGSQLVSAGHKINDESTNPPRQPWELTCMAGIIACRRECAPRSPPSHLRHVPPH